MTVHGIIEEFQSTQENWLSYTERLEQYFTANDIVGGDKQWAILLSSVSPSTYQLIRNLISLEKSTEKSFDKIVKVIAEHHQPPPSMIVQRFTFNSRCRRSRKSISSYIAELCKLSEHCEYGDTFNDMLRDRLVYGIDDQRMQRRLLQEVKLTFTQARDMVLAMEAADRNARELEPTMPPGTVHELSDDSRCQFKGGSHGGSGASSCYRCGGKHAVDKCRFKESERHYCKKKGHLAKVCCSRRRDDTKYPRHSRNNPHKQPTGGTNHIKPQDADQEEEVLTLLRTRAIPMMVTVRLNEAELQMEVDTGASVSLISEATYKKLWSTMHRPQTDASSRKLQMYTGEKLNVLGSITIDVEYQTQRHTLPLLVVAGTGPSLLGRDWMRKILLDWQQLNPRPINKVHQVPPNALQSILDCHSMIFREELGKVKGVSTKIFLDPSARPRFCKPRTIPYALRTKVNKELERLEAAGVIEPIQFSDWAAPIVPMLKQDGSLRICGDYKVTVNQAAKLDTYTLSRIDDLFASLAGEKQFSQLDLAHTYQQIPLDEESWKLVVVNTHKGLFCYNRLPFGISSAPTIFQRTIEGILRGIPHVCVYLDDILISGNSTEDHLKNLEAVMTKLEDAGMRLKVKKCAFLLDSVEYLGHKISAERLQPTQEKVRAITHAPAPQNISQLRAFLGLLNYYGKFLPQLASTLAPFLIQAPRKEDKVCLG